MSAVLLGGENIFYFYILSLFYPLSGDCHLCMKFPILSTAHVREEEAADSNKEYF
jgi:hypothetical protein